MAAAFDNDTRELIRLWADKAPECGATDKPRAFPDVNGVDIPLSRNTVYTGKWKFRYAFDPVDGFPVVQGGPIPHGQDTQQPKGKLSKPKVILNAKANPNKGSFSKAVEAEMAKLTKPVWSWMDDPADEVIDIVSHEIHVQAHKKAMIANLPCPIHFTSIGKCGCPGPSYIPDPDDNF